MCPTDAAETSLGRVSLPVPAGWDFGAEPYGHERLVLPSDYLGQDNAGPAPALSFGSLAAARHQILTSGPVTCLHSERPLPANAGLFSFRWMIGHQTTFILWRLLARDLAAATSAGAMAIAAPVARRLGCFIDGYSAMLLYCGSCPRNVYNDVIRVSMEAHYSGFSGSWARDYRPVRKLLHDRSGGIGRLVRHHSELNEIIHDGIARKLVPSGTSLLQAAAASKQLTRVPRRSELFAVYDSYFLTTRVSVPVEMVLVQLARRLRAIRADLALNGLYPSWAPSEHDEPGELAGPDVLACKRGLPDLLYDIRASAIAAAVPCPPSEQEPANYLGVM